MYMTASTYLGSVTSYGHNVRKCSLWKFCISYLREKKIRKLVVRFLSFISEEPTAK